MCNMYKQNFNVNDKNYTDGLRIQCGILLNKKGALELEDNLAKMEDCETSKTNLTAGDTCSWKACLGEDGEVQGTNCK